MSKNCNCFQKNCAKSFFLIVLCVQLLSCWRTIILSVVPGYQADSRQRKWSFTGVKATDQLALNTASTARGSPLRWVQRHVLVFSEKTKSECIAVVRGNCEIGQCFFQWTYHFAGPSGPRSTLSIISHVLLQCQLRALLCWPCQLSYPMG